MHKRRLCFQWLREASVNAPDGANKADPRPNPALAQPFGSGRVVRAPFRLKRNSNEDEDIDAASRRFR
jgi:hypothetical protein